MAKRSAKKKPAELTLVEAASLALAQPETAAVEPPARHAAVRGLHHRIGGDCAVAHCALICRALISAW